MNDEVLRKLTAHADMAARLQDLEVGFEWTSWRSWSDFYTLIGATAGTLIGLIFVVVSLGADHAKAGDEHRAPIGVTPTLVHFAALLVGALAMLAPLSNIARAVALGLIGCAGLAYLVNLALLAPSGSRMRSATHCGSGSCRWRLMPGLW